MPQKTIVDQQQLTKEIESAINAAMDAATQRNANTQPAIAPGVPWHEDHDIPAGAQKVSIVFFVMCALTIVGLPLSRALSRWIDRRDAAPHGALNSQSDQQLQRIAQAVDAMSIEVERISESQRFMAKLQVGEGAERVQR